MKSKNKHFRQSAYSHSLIDRIKMLNEENTKLRKQLKDLNKILNDIPEITTETRSLWRKLYDKFY